ncbi:MAG: family 78 glycoside hydrolase catalytic domain, partial [Anaerolineae bacterium]|nr:family 78 glycoside hydrolase catalytic domain [Anaerolineae bacterium]
VCGVRGQRISLKFAESLYQDGTVNQENLRGARAEDVYILKGQGEEIWEPRFTYHGFRYIQLEGYAGTPDQKTIEGRVVRSAVAPSGTFECSNALFNKIHKLVWQTEAANLHSLPTDCPQRDERMGWLNDMAARTEEAIYNFDLVRLLSKWVADIADDQDPRTGAITDTAPFRWGRRPADPVSVCYLLIPWLLYVHYGDTHTMAERYAGMKAWVDYLASRSEGHILRYSYYGDWAPPIQFGLQGSQGSSAVSKDTPGELISTACYAYSVRLLSQIAQALGYAKDAASYQDLAGRIADRFHSYFWDDETGGYGTNNQSCNAISLYMGLVPETNFAQVAANLAENVVACHHSHLTTGNICTKYLLEALSIAGRVDIASQIASKETYPSWGFMLANGATTLWERWELETGDGMNSHNHSMLGSVGAWFYRFIAGIQADPAGPGFQYFYVCPRPVGDLKHARACLKTVHGDISSAWKVSGRRMEIDLTIPVNSQARLCLPWVEDAILYEGETILWEGGQPNEFSVGIEWINVEGPHLVCLVGSGEYHFCVDSETLFVSR